MTLLLDRAEARNRNVDLGDEAGLTILTDIEKADRDRAWWAAEAARTGTDWRSLADAVLEMLVAAGIVEQPQLETITPWDAPPWREAAVEYHRDRSGHLAVEIEPKRLERLRPLMADSISLERVYDEIGRDRATPAVTVEALKLAVRVHGPKTLAEPTNKERLRRCDAYARDRLDRWIADFKKGNCL
jgi:hypothetical protein